MAACFATRVPPKARMNPQEHSLPLLKRSSARLSCSSWRSFREKWLPRRQARRCCRFPQIQIDKESASKTANNDGKIWTAGNLILATKKPRNH